MICRSPLTLAMTGKNKIVPIVPCGQCLNCRLDRRDKWVTRCLLESRSAITGQFWTLTFSDHGLTNLSEKGARRLFRNFSRALQLKEQRAANPLKVRCFGILEHGETLGRPHIHLLVWNALNTSLTTTPYKEGLPRPRLHIPQWPHGHVDAMPLNTKSCRYVCKYITKFEVENPQENIAFHCQRPPLGYHGLASHIESLSRGPTRQWEHSPFIEIDGKKWALDQTMQRHFWRLCLIHGLKHSAIPTWRRDQYAKECLQTRLMEKEIEPASIDRKRLDNEEQRARIYEITRNNKEVRKFQSFVSALQFSPSPPLQAVH